MKKAHRILPLFLALAATLLSGACGSATSPQSGLNILASVSSQTAESLTFRIGVENTGTKTERLSFTSSQFFDIEVRDVVGRLIWRFSADALFLDLLWGLELAPGESSTQEYIWHITGRDLSSSLFASYKAKIWITSNPRNEDLATELRLTF